MTKELKINFFPLQVVDFEVPCYRKKCLTVNEDRPDESCYRFVEDRSIKNSVAYWITIAPRKDFEPYSFRSIKQPMATRWICSRLILNGLMKDINKRPLYKAEMLPGFYPKLKVLVKEHRNVGWQGFIVDFDWHSVLRCHGLYVNFHFFKKDEYPFDAVVQKLSFSLDAQGGANRDFYKCQFDWVRAFHTRFLQDLKIDLTSNTVVQFATVPSLNGMVLNGKVFEFGNKEVNRSPYWGLRNFGPYQKCSEEPTFFFVFREEHRQSAMFLCECLRGREFHERFPGMTDFFKVPFGHGNVQYVVMRGSGADAHHSAAEQIVNAGCANPVAIVLVTGDEQEYLLQKSVYLNYGIPSQDVKVDKTRMGQGFQWLVAGIALQLFCKAGGTPWCVRTARNRDLIIGISQLWERSDIESKRFVAYSVTTDANGFFKNIQTLADCAAEKEYVDDLARHIKEQLINYIRNDRPERIVLHCSFRLLRSAMEAIRRVSREIMTSAADSPRIVIMRINTEHHYQGFDASRQTMVPDENTIMRIKENAYLVWPDGTPRGGVVTSRPSGPVYVAFDRAEPPLTKEDEIELLQNLCNLAGANWRGFNAKARPVSVFYCHLVGRMIADMARYNLPLPKIEKFVPWFL